MNRVKVSLRVSLTVNTLYNRDPASPDGSAVVPKCTPEILIVFTIFKCTGKCEAITEDVT